MTVAGINQTFTVGTHPIDRRYVAQVFNRTSRQQAVPVQATRTGPVRGVQQQVSVVGITAPHRESQVVANQWTNTPAFDFKLNLTLARGEVFVLTRHAEQMTLIVVQHFTIRARPQQTITVAAISGLDDDASGHDSIKLFGLRNQPRVSRPLFRLCQSF